MEAGALKKHVESKHEEVRYPCPQCVYVGTQSSSLKKHVKKNMKDIPALNVSMLQLQHRI